MAPRCAGGPDSVRAFCSVAVRRGRGTGGLATKGPPMPYIRLFQAAFGRLRGQSSLATRGTSPKSDTLLRVVGVGLVVTGVLLIGTATVVAAAKPCNHNGLPNPCFFTPEQDTGTPLASLKTVTKPQDAQLTVGGAFIANQDVVLELGKALFWD